jgi:hypothetical protein
MLEDDFGRALDEPRETERQHHRRVPSADRACQEAPSDFQGGSSRPADIDHVLGRVIGGSMEGNKRHCGRVWIAARRR